MSQNAIDEEVSVVEYSFESQVRKIHSTLFLYLYALLNDRELAREAMHRTLLTAYSYYGALKDQDKFKSWILALGKKEAMAIAKASKIYMPSQLNAYQMITMKDTLEPLPDRILEDKYIKHAITNAILNLREELREVVVLYYHMKIGPEDIARIYNVNPNTVKTRIKLAKANIHSQIKETYS